MSATFEIKSTEKLNDRVRKGTNFLKENTPEAKKTDVQHLFALLAGQPNWQTLHAEVSKSKELTDNYFDDELYQKLINTDVGDNPDYLVRQIFMREAHNEGDLHSAALVEALKTLDILWFQKKLDKTPTSEAVEDIDILCAKLQAYKKAALRAAGEDDGTPHLEPKTSPKHSLEPMFNDVYSDAGREYMPYGVKFTPTEEIISFIKAKMYQSKKANATLSITDFPGRHECLTWYNRCPEDLKYAEPDENVLADEDCTYCPVLVVDEDWFYFKCHNKSTGVDCESESFCLD